MAFIRLGGTSSDSAQEVKKAFEKLAPVLGSDLRQIISEVEQGAARLFCADNECYFILRGEVDLTGRELVIVAMSGSNGLKHVKEIHKRAKLAGYQSVRLHTLKPAAMLRLGRGLGYKQAETILRAVI